MYFSCFHLLPLLCSSFFILSYFRKEKKKRQVIQFIRTISYYNSWLHFAFIIVVSACFFSASFSQTCNWTDFFLSSFHCCCCCCCMILVRIIFKHNNKNKNLKRNITENEPYYVGTIEWNPKNYWMDVNDKYETDNFKKNFVVEYYIKRKNANSKKRDEAKEWKIQEIENKRNEKEERR